MADSKPAGGSSNLSTPAKYILSMVTLTSRNDFKSTIAQSEGPVLVILGAKWDPNTAKIQEWASKLESNINTYYVDIDDTPGIEMDFSIRGVPTVVLLEKGKIVETVFGAQLMTESGFLEILR
jgi:thioredoxin-like negative regulator of GroEL